MTNSNETTKHVETAQGEGDNQNQEQQVSNQEESQESIFETLVGQDRKYADAETLAKSKLEADNHIKTVEQENAELRSKVQSMDNNYQQILKKLEQMDNVSDKTKDAEPQAKKTTTEDIDLDKWFEEKLTKTEQRKREAALIDESRNRLVEAYGNKKTADKAITQLLEQKPYMRSAINELLKTNPEGLVKEITSFVSPESIGSQSNDPVAHVAGHSGETGGYITWKEANEIRRKDIKRYNSKEFQDLVSKSVAYYKSKGIDYYA